MKLSVVVVNWNTCDILRCCLEKLLAAMEGIEGEVVVVDNGSTDGSGAMVRSFFPSVRMLENVENLGFPRAVNQGIHVSAGEYVALVNSDIMVTTAGLKQMVEHLDNNDDVAAVGPQLVGRAGHLQYSGGYAPSPLAALHQLVGIQSLLGGYSRALFVRTRYGKRALPVDWLCAACLMVRRQAMDEVGLLDDSHFMYAEDVEFGLRLRRGGWRLHLIPWIRVLHYGGASSAKISEAKLLWLGGFFRVAANQLPRSAYSIFGVLLSASFLLRMLLLGVLHLAHGHDRGGRSEVAAMGDLGLYAWTAFKLGLHEPVFATEYCARLEESCRRARMPVSGE